jgi:hypothetical protein
MRIDKGVFMKRIIVFIVITLTFAIHSTFSQTRKERVRAARAQINTLLATYANGPYEAGEVVDVDSSIGVRKVASGRISNPYGTLNRCYLFMAKTQGEDGKHTVGVYTDNQIIWMSEQLPGSQYYGYVDEAFIATKDLNRAGKVDIVVYFSDGTNPPSEHYLWIFSWDGSQGVCINRQQSDSSTSIISSGAFNIYDVDGDGTDEIFSYKSDFSFDAVYSWNGSLYGVWPSTPNLTGRLYTIANNFTAIFNVVVTRDGEKFTYSYKVKNNQESKQNIKWISVSETNNLVDTVIAPMDWRGGRFSNYSIVLYNAVEDSVQLLAGSQSAGFIIRCYGLPIISKFYLQAPYEDLDLSSVTVHELMNRMYQNILNNSLTGFTISAGSPPSPFIPLNFLDTLTGYTNQSRTLGWIKDQATANKYLGYFASAKTSLQQNNIDSARIKLQLVLNDVNVDSTSHLTSEAYALLRYNTEYLSDNPLLPVEITSFTGTVRGSNVALTWKTATEVNSSTFEIERRTTGGWKKIGELHAAGTSNAPREYTYVDDMKNIGSGNIRYRLKTIDNDGSYKYSSEVEVVAIPQVYALENNFPNPFNPETKIQYSLPENAKVHLSVYDVIGRQVAELVNEEQSAGYYEKTFTGFNLSSGIYFYRITAQARGKSTFTQVKKMLLVK